VDGCPETAGNPQRQSRLADATGTGEREQPYLAELVTRLYRSASRPMKVPDTVATSARIGACGSDELGGGRPVIGVHCYLVAELTTIGRRDGFLHLHWLVPDIQDGTEDTGDRHPCGRRRDAASCGVGIRLTRSSMERAIRRALVFAEPAAGPHRGGYLFGHTKIQGRACWCAA